MVDAGALSDDARELQRLRWRCRRGMRELDALVLRYLERCWPGDSDAQRRAFLTLLDTEDDVLWRWCMGHEAPTDVEVLALVERIRQLPP